MSGLPNWLKWSKEKGKYVIVEPEKKLWVETLEDADIFGEEE